VHVSVQEVDPLGVEALTLLREAALEARQLYPEFYDPKAPGPTNQPTPPRGVYLVAFAGKEPVGMGAHRPLNCESSEVRRMFVSRRARGQGIARAILAQIEAHARAQGFARLVLETGNRQLPAIRLYESSGFHRIPAFGNYADDPTSVCFEKSL
jgi:GNAT superfamily N-acetyltransferase